MIFGFEFLDRIKKYGSETKALIGGTGQQIKGSLKKGEHNGMNYIIPCPSRIKIKTSSSPSCLIVLKPGFSEGQLNWNHFPRSETSE